MTLKLQCKKLWTTFFSIKYFIVSFYSYVFYFVFFESLLYTTIRILISLVSFYFSFTKMSHHRCIHISECAWIRSIFERMHLFLWKTCSRWIFSHSFSLSRDDLAFFLQAVTTSLFIPCVRTMCFVLHSFNNVEFICNLYSRSSSLSFLKHFNFSFAHISQWPRHAVDCIEFIHLFYNFTSKTYHWNHIHSYFTSGNIYRFSLRIVCKKKVWTTWNTFREKENIWNV